MNATILSTKPWRSRNGRISASFDHSSLWISGNIYKKKHFFLWNGNWNYMQSFRFFTGWTANTMRHSPMTTSRNRSNIKWNSSQLWWNKTFWPESRKIYWSKETNKQYFFHKSSNNKIGISIFSSKQLRNYLDNWIL